MGRPPKRPSERKNQYVSLSVEKVRMKAYRDAAAAGFSGNLANFLRAAADALAAQLGHPVPPTEKPDKS